MKKSNTTMWYWLGGAAVIGVGLYFYEQSKVTPPPPAPAPLPPTTVTPAPPAIPAIGPLVTTFLPGLKYSFAGTAAAYFGNQTITDQASFVAALTSAGWTSVVTTFVSGAFMATGIWGRNYPQAVPVGISAVQA